MTWEGVPSIRVALSDGLAGGGGGGGSTGGGGAGGGGMSGQGRQGISARTATLLKHPARVINMIMIMIYTILLAHLTTCSMSFNVDYDFMIIYCLLQANPSF